MILNIPLMHVSLGRPAGKRSDWTMVRNVTIPVEIEAASSADVEQVATVAMTAHDGAGEEFIRHEGAFWVRTNTPIDRYGDFYPTEPVASDGYDTLALTPPNRRGKYKRASDFFVSMTMSRTFRDPACPEIEREGTHKSVFFETEAEFQDAVSRASNVRPSSETIAAIETLKERAKDLLLVGGVPYRRCEEPYLSLANKNFSRIELYWGWGQNKRPPVDLPRWPLTAFDEIADWVRNRFPSQTVPLPHKLEIERPEHLSQWNGAAGLIGAAKNMLGVMIVALPQADLPFMESFMFLRDTLDGDLESIDLAATIEETFAAIRHHPVMTDERLTAIVQALPLDLQDRLSSMTSYIDRADIVALSM